VYLPVKGTPWARRQFNLGIEFILYSWAEDKMIEKGKKGIEKGRN
jgi:hypothetical protein